MNDDELEKTLQRYRPVGLPSPARVLPRKRPPGRVVAATVWMPIAAALMAATALYWLSAREHAAVHLRVDRAAVARAANVRLVSRVLGGGSHSLVAADFVVSLDEPKVERGR